MRRPWSKCRRGWQQLRRTEPSGQSACSYESISVFASGSLRPCGRKMRCWKRSWTRHIHWEWGELTICCLFTTPTTAYLNRTVARAAPSRHVRHSNDRVRPRAIKMSRTSTRKKVGPQARSDGSVSDLRWAPMWKSLESTRERKIREKKHRREASQVRSM